MFGGESSAGHRATETHESRTIQPWTSSYQSLWRKASGEHANPSETKTLPFSGVNSVLASMSRVCIRNFRNEPGLGVQRLSANLHGIEALLGNCYGFFFQKLHRSFPKEGSRRSFPKGFPEEFSEGKGLEKPYGCPRGDNQRGQHLPHKEEPIHLLAIGSSRCERRRSAGWLPVNEAVLQCHFTSCALRCGLSSNRLSVRSSVAGFVRPTIRASIHQPAHRSASFHPNTLPTDFESSHCVRSNAFLPPQTISKELRRMDRFRLSLSLSRLPQPLLPIVRANARWW